MLFEWQPRVPTSSPSTWRASCRRAFRTIRPLRRTSPRRCGWSKTPVVESSPLPTTSGTSTELRQVVDDGVAAFGRLDVIVANAGITAPQVWSDITPEDFRDVIDVNVTGTWNTVMAGAQKIIDGGRGGSIILISSAAGIKMQPFMIHYTTSKHAVTGMARAFAAELGKHSIRVNSVHPGPVLTAMGTGDMVDTLVKATETNPQLANMLTPFLPTWVAEPDDIADAVLWLASDESRNVTASQIAVDQGSTQY